MDLFELLARLSPAERLELAAFDAAIRHWLRSGAHRTRLQAWRRCLPVFLRPLLTPGGASDESRRCLSPLALKDVALDDLVPQNLAEMFDADLCVARHRPGPIDGSS